ncbi:hypothetical protein [Capnocytophaga sp. oral taxon 338]|uniref:hypothetical protein n=1 Tax=Capnocytophaga sp. oral taxon 338 TaxID=710239 RepID=UPI000202D6CE|nr:hypothetical protein [Capnocytophaga sp. oral taxon 338]EGD33342.1 hypothetical protein HMPREF9071_2136 [Capnocytophaga sp. oral taxon 338 str. F0234]
MQIIQKTTRITAKEEVQGISVMYSYEFEKDQNPQAVAFSVQKNIETQGSYSYLQGTVTEHDFNMQNNNFQLSDIDLIKHIHTTCTAIIKGESNEKPKANDTKK